jgi:hypothetical protein
MRVDLQLDDRLEFAAPTARFELDAIWDIDHGALEEGGVGVTNCGRCLCLENDVFTFKSSRPACLLTTQSTICLCLRHLDRLTAVCTYLDTGADFVYIW